MEKSGWILSLIGVVFAVGCGSAGNGYMNSGYTLEELDAKGVNTQHLFVLTDERAAYNGREFSIDIAVDSLIETFGPDYRIHYGKAHNTGYDHYFWDKIGFVALVSPEKEVMAWSLHWDYLPKVKDYDYDDPEPDLVPTEFFRGKILLNGVPLDNTSDYAAYCENQKVQQQLRRLASKKGIENYAACFYYYHPKTINRYEHFYHKLYLFDYTKFEDHPFFSYRMKITSETGQLHELGMQYDVYTNPDFVDIF